MNHLVLEGIVEATPIAKVAKSGTTYSVFPLRVGKHLFQIVAFYEANRAAAILRQGDHARLDGSLTSEVYQDKNGIERTSIKISVKSVAKLSNHDAPAEEPIDVPF